ncbi:MAG: ATP-binding protein [Nonlabens sp.]
MEKIPPQSRFTGKRIVLYGPESTGKSTLGQQLARHYKTECVPEFAREYLQDKYDSSGDACDFQDLLPIAIGQRETENQIVKTAVDYLFCDTDALETLVYSNYYFNEVPAAIASSIQESSYDLYLLLSIDLPWVKDDLRDRPDDREVLYKRFENELLNYNKPYQKVSGIEYTRFANAVRAIEEHFSKNEVK